MRIVSFMLPLFHSDRRIKFLWDVIILAVTVAVAIIFPLLVVFDVPASAWQVVLDLGVTALFSADVLVKIYLAKIRYQSSDPNRRRTTRHYLHGLFVFDVVAALPLYLLSLVFSWDDPVRAVQFLSLIRLVKLFASSGIIREIRSTHVNPAVMRLVHLVFWILVTAHLVSCGWILMGGPGRYFETGVSTSAELYMEAFYWTVTTMTTVGYGDITPSKPVQFLYVIVVMLMGAAIYGFIIGNIANIIARIDVTRSKFREKVESIDTLLKYRNVPPDLKQRILDYYEYLWVNHRGYEESRLLADLPRGLKTQLAYELNRDIIEKIPLFRHTADVMKRELVLNLQPVVYTPGDIIVYCGEIGHEMYFINQGHVDVLNRDGTVLHTTLSSGQYFGEIALLLSTPRTATVKARSYCDIYVLDRKTFETVAEHYPDFARTMDELAESRRLELGLDKTDSLRKV